jgi:hypothetical protein
MIDIYPEYSFNSSGDTFFDHLSEITGHVMVLEPALVLKQAAPKCWKYIIKKLHAGKILMLM